MFNALAYALSETTEKMCGADHHGQSLARLCPHRPELVSAEKLVAILTATHVSEETTKKPGQEARRTFHGNFTLAQSVPIVLIASTPAEMAQCDDVSARVKEREWRSRLLVLWIGEGTQPETKRLPTLSPIIMQRAARRDVSWMEALILANDEKEALAAREASQDPAARVVVPAPAPVG